MLRRSLARIAALVAMLVPVAARAAEVSGPQVDSADTVWILISSALVLMMSVPALALFYGGLVRSKNMLSVLMPMRV